ncbi:ATP-binding component of sugar ABC transporter [Gammaproteobacteria bacterium]|nr:ATP-binding component of sugar ABC transporter [Gammaproteobacteria bacterium]
MTKMILEMINVNKRFGNTYALNDMQLKIQAGEIHALMGENGAGKSTLMKILAGVYSPDSGIIKLDGKPIKIQNPIEARKVGISLIYQELSIATNLTVAENVFMGAEPTRYGLIDYATMNYKTDVILKKLGTKFTSTSNASTLSIADQQQVEIARALTHKSRILIMDEPTAALSDRESMALFKLIKQLKEQGLAIIYISHRMKEVYELAQRVSVMRDGYFIKELDHVDPTQIVSLMVGRKMDGFYKKEINTSKCFGPVVMKVETISKAPHIKPISFSVRSGEILGLSGLVGAGRTELARLIFGADTATTGKIYVNNQIVNINSPRDAIRAGIGYVPEDRKCQGLFLELSVLENSQMSVLNQRSNKGILNHPMLEKRTQQLISALNIKTNSSSSTVSGLSGGNQQKVLLAHWLEIKPKILILDEPTRGVDIGAKTEIYKIIQKLADDGIAIICISSELPEIIGLADRVLVMREGEIVGEISDTHHITQENIMQFATGAK